MKLVDLHMLYIIILKVLIINYIKNLKREI